MKLIYAQEKIIKNGFTLMLCGPTPRTQDIKSWRPEAIEIISFLERQRNMDITAIVPEPRDGIFCTEYDTQVQWEEEALKAADVIMFWCPRNISGGMPGFTTNDEFGAWKSSGKVVWGNPIGVDKVKYQLYYANKLKIPISNTLIGTINNAFDLYAAIKKEINIATAMFVLVICVSVSIAIL